MTFSQITSIFVDLLLVAFSLAWVTQKWKDYIHEHPRHSDAR